MKIIFLDESGDHSLIKIDKQFPVFCLAGAVFDENKYAKIDNAKIDAFKIHHFKSKNIILHSREIRKCEAPFNILMNPKTKKTFYKDLDNLISSLKFTTLASVIIKNKLCSKYSDPTNPYSLSLQFIMERFLYYLEECDDVGYFSVESRDPKSNTNLLNTFTEIINNGSGSGAHYIAPERFQKRIQKMDFVTKKQNQNGHQIADLVAYPIAKYGLSKNKLNPAFEIIKPKFRSKNGRISGYGLKIFP